MTKNSELKQRIRARMERTGERYTAARAHVLVSAAPAAESRAYPGLFPGYGPLGGMQSDTGLLARVFAHAGIAHPATGQPYSEAMLHGLCGGLGFLYAVFEYKGHAPMLTVVLRSRSMPQAFIPGAFERAGVERQVSRTTSARAAAKALEQALAEERPAICVVDLAMLPYAKWPGQMAGMSPHYVGVVGGDDESVWLDDRALVPLSISRNDLAAARASYRKAKHELFTVAPSATPVDWKLELRSAIRDTARTLRDGDPTVPASFRSNCGLAGMDKWRRLLTDPKDKKSWKRVFPSGEHALAGLRRAYDGIQHEYTAPRGGRPLYAEFLDEAAALLGERALSATSKWVRESGERWQALADCIAGAPDAAVAQACRTADLRTEALDGGGQEALASTPEPRESCALDAGAAEQLYAEMAQILSEIVVLETRIAEGLAALE